MSESVFGSDNVIVEQISEGNLKTYLVGFDINDIGEKEYRWLNLINVLQEVIPEFAFGFHKNENIAISKATPSFICEAAKAIYKIQEFEEVRRIYLELDSYIEDDDIKSKYLKRGEFGELVLHLLLRDFHHTIPLLSKIYFKDSFGATVHGFDAVHIQPETKTLWLGESKLYSDGKKGILALVEDIVQHFNRDYMNDEFVLISKKVELFGNIPEKDYWLNLMDKNAKLIDQFESISIPLVCTYSSDLFGYYSDEKDPAFLNEYENEVRELKALFDKHNKHQLKPYLNIVLMLFPVKSKTELVKKLHRRLAHLQVINDV
ncbi:hypothetical protein BK121_03385 [Paenibacillus odorifer]|uniref:HamA C-terminal domain-containing protein n=1 Tax=Paenibacillus odorifer TaxID=189426 RepID=UPI00096D9699|nr:DUF1837 domain-containing protein [Paenibacillus odorifer]OMC75830.1 hypothetical protein BK121_03385 [Paenibacillus odorifer]